MIAIISDSIQPELATELAQCMESQVKAGATGFVLCGVCPDDQVVLDWRHVTRGQMALCQNGLSEAIIENILQSHGLIEEAEDDEDFDSPD